MPVDPDVQKATILKAYNERRLIADQKFTLAVEKRYKCLMKHVS